MLENQSVLLVEDEILIAMDLAEAIVDRGGVAIGPAVGNRQALALLASERVTAAILDVNVRDGEVTPTAIEILARRIPFIVYSASPLPARLRSVFGHAPFLAKPMPSNEVIRALAQIVEKDRVLETV